MFAEKVSAILFFSCYSDMYCMVLLKQPFSINYMTKYTGVSRYLTNWLFLLFHTINPMKWYHTVFENNLTMLTLSFTFLFLQIVLLLRLAPLLPFSMLNYFLAVMPIGIGEYTMASWLGMMVSLFNLFHAMIEDAN